MLPEARRWGGPGPDRGDRELAPREMLAVLAVDGKWPAGGLQGLEKEAFYVIRKRVTFLGPARMELLSSQTPVLLAES